MAIRVLGAAFLFLAASVVSAGSAQAASQAVTHNCTSLAADTPISLTVGDTLTISSSSCTDVWFRSGVGSVEANGGPVSVGTSVPVTPPVTTVYTATASGSANLMVYVLGASPSVRATFLITVTDAAASGDGGLSGPRPIVQQFGKPALGSCDEVAVDSLNWPGAPSGGWGNSWAQWMNDGLGGEVCSRTLTFSNSISAWTVG